MKLFGIMFYSHDFDDIKLTFNSHLLPLLYFYPPVPFTVIFPLPKVAILANNFDLAEVIRKHSGQIPGAYSKKCEHAVPAFCLVSSRIVSLSNSTHFLVRLVSVACNLVVVGHSSA